MVLCEILLVLLCAMGLLSETLCSFTLEAESGESVTIWCQHELTASGSIFWFKHTTDSVPLLLGCKTFRKSAPSQNCYFYKDTERLVMFVQHENTSLTITALNISDTGLYYCSTMALNKLTFRNATYLHVRGVNQTIVTENKEEGCFSTTLIFVLNAVFGLVVVILLSGLIFILLKHRNTHGGAETEDHEESDLNTLHYAALKFSKKKTKRRKRPDETLDEHAVYSSVKRSDEYHNSSKTSN